MSKKQKRLTVPSFDIPYLYFSVLFIFVLSTTQGVALKPVLYLSEYIGLIFHLNYALRRLNSYVWRIHLLN